jgi:caffeoyl-CoA O-methyltransferase
MQLIPTAINNYVEQFSDAEDSTLTALSRETHLKIQMPQMISGNLQGKFLEMVVHMLQPKNILEIGTFTGYSGICFAKAMPVDGTLTTIDINDELEEIITKYMQKANVWNKVNFLKGNAIDIIQTLTETYDLVFIDADKHNYSNYFNLVIDKVRKGGFIIADNVLWSGKVVEGKKDKDTTAIHQYNLLVQQDHRVENFILPLRDGLNIARKLV